MGFVPSITSRRASHVVSSPRIAGRGGNKFQHTSSAFKNVTRKHVKSLVICWLQRLQPEPSKTSPRVKFLQPERIWGQPGGISHHRARIRPRVGGRRLPPGRACTLLESTAEHGRLRIHWYQKTFRNLAHRDRESKYLSGPLARKRFPSMWSVRYAYRYYVSNKNGAYLEILKYYNSSNRKSPSRRNG